MKVSTAPVPRRLFSDPRFLGLRHDTAHYLLRLYCTCDSWGRFAVGELSLSARVGYVDEHWEDLVTELSLAGLIGLYNVAGYRYGVIEGYDAILDARTKERRSESQLPAPNEAELRFDDDVALLKLPENYGLRRAVELVCRSLITRTDAIPLISHDVRKRLEQGYDTEALARALMLCLGGNQTDSPAAEFWPRVESAYAVEVKLIKRTSSVTSDEDEACLELCEALAGKRYREPRYGDVAQSQEQHVAETTAEYLDELHGLAARHRPYFISEARAFVDSGIEALRSGPYGPDATRPLRARLESRARATRKRRVG